MNWCRLNDGGVVVETTAIDPAGRFVAEIVWRECPDAVAPGWTFDGEAFARHADVPAPAPQIISDRRRSRSPNDERKR